MSLEGGEGDGTGAEGDGRGGRERRDDLYWNGQLVWTPALGLYLCVWERGMCPAGFIAHLFAP